MTASTASSRFTDQTRLGLGLVAASAIVWSTGGMIARFIEMDDPWSVVFWRSLFAAAFLLAFMLLREGPAESVAMFRRMGWPGLGVASCFAIASTSFVVALQYTTVANLLLIQAGAPLIAAVLAWVLFGEKVRADTWLAIAGVLTGIAIMVSGSLTGKVSPIGDGLSLLVTTCFATATVITWRWSHIPMVPAVLLATVIAAIISGSMVPEWPSLSDGWLLFLFGAFNLGLGLALFVTGTKRVTAAVAALVGTLEPVLGPVWVWLAHGEEPERRTLIGGAFVITALVFYLLGRWRG